MARKGEEKAKDKEEKAEEADGSSARRKEEAILLKSNRMLGKHGTGKTVAMTKTNGHGSHTQKSPMPGKKGKNKGKWSSKDGKGDGGKDHVANTASDTPQPSSSTTHQTFLAMNADHDFLREFESKGDLHVPHDPCVQSFMSVPEDEFSYLKHALTPTSMVQESSPGTHGVL